MALLCCAELHASAYIYRYYVALVSFFYYIHIYINGIMCIRIDFTRIYIRACLVYSPAKLFMCQVHICNTHRRYFYMFRIYIYKSCELLTRAWRQFIDLDIINVWEMLLVYNVFKFKFVFI